MEKSKFSVSQIIGGLKEAKAGWTMKDICRDCRCGPRIFMGWDFVSRERISAIRALHKAILRSHPWEGIWFPVIEAFSLPARILWQYSIKAQLIHHGRFHNFAEAEQALVNNIEVYYN